ncbi:MAG: tRNA (adenosine(37)-N6)-dimethylallyltransferase MiaA [Eubacteriales bacterium]|nr:tRNA (adenosine(37)-N6)-dimethylallyltransferase MiaA [Eubacteriales bacterium]
MKPVLIALCGPTASGKSSLAMRLAKELPIEIVGMDAFQIYEHLNIGTAKPTLEEMQQVPHFMIDIAHPNMPYSVAQYREDAMKCIDDILSRNKLPVLVGGTGMYLRALSLPLSYGGKQSDLNLRKKYEEYADKNGNIALHELLKDKDPKTYDRLHPNDTRRIIRALEVWHLTGVAFSEQEMPKYSDGKYNILPFAFDWDRDILYQRINERTEQMFCDGLLKELEDILAMGVSPNAQSMQAIGYKECIPCLNGEYSVYEAKSLVQLHSRQYAKRQLTWFRKDERLTWLKPAEGLDAAVKTILNKKKETENAKH